MKYYYKIFINEGYEESLKSINAPESFLKSLKESSSFNAHLEDGMTDFYVGYDIEKVRKGKPNDAWTWCSIKNYYRVNWTYKGEIRPKRKDAVNKLKKLWENE